MQLPEGIDPAVVKAKIDAGLSQEQAIEVAVSQKNQDDAAQATSNPAPLEDLTVDDLKKLAEGKGIELSSGMKKADIIAALQA